MPIFDTQSFLALLGCFVTGSWLAAALERRRFGRELAQRERDMTSALKTRYDAYEGLERNVRSLIGKFDALEADVRGRSVRPSELLAGLDTALRSSNPELWDLEREHHRERAQHLAEISRQAGRIAGLMDQMPVLESSSDAMRAELEHTQARLETAVANAREAERAADLKVERLERRMAELEPLESMFAAAQREIDAAQANHREARQRHDDMVGALQQRVDALQPLEAQVAALSTELSQRDQDAARKELDVAGLEAKLEMAEAAHRTLDARCQQLAAEGGSARDSLAETNATLAGMRLAQAELQAELERCSADLRHASENGARSLEELAALRESVQLAQAESASTKLALDGQRDQTTTLERALATAKTEIAQYRVKVNAHSSHVEQAWSVLSELKPMLQELEDKLKEPDDVPTSTPSFDGWLDEAARDDVSSR